MVPGPKAIINEGAVVVVVIRATIANSAVERILWFYDLIKNAQIVQVNVIIQEFVNKPYEVKLWLQVSWLH